MRRGGNSTAGRLLRRRLTAIVAMAATALASSLFLGRATASVSADNLELVDWSGALTNSPAGFTVTELEMTVRGQRPIASNGDFQAGRPTGSLNFFCYDPPGSTNVVLSSGSIFPLAEDLVSTVGDTRIYRRVIAVGGQVGGECRGVDLQLRDVTGDTWAYFRSADELEAAGFQRVWTVGSGFTRSVEMRLAHKQDSGWSHDVLLYGFEPTPNATISCFREDELQPYEVVTASFVPGFGGQGAQEVCLSETPGGHWAVVDGVRSNSVSWDAALPPPTTFKYVALGDSFSAGEGIEPFFEDPSNKCHRSKLAYSTLIEPPGVSGLPIYLLAQNGLPYEWGFQACSGAVTDDILTTGQWGDPLPQLAPDRSADTGNPNDLPVDSKTDLVTITIGGNDVGGAPGTQDVGFASVLKYCWLTTECENTTKNGMTYPKYLQKTIDDTRVKLRQVYQAILAQASSSEVFVLGYPQLLPESPADMNCAKIRQTKFRLVIGQPPFQIVKVVSIGFSIPEQRMIRELAVQLNKTIVDTVVSTLSPRIHFVPVAQYFAGHEICVDDQGGEWINGPTPAWQKNFVSDQSFHPKDVGQAAYAYCANKFLQGSSC